MIYSKREMDRYVQIKYMLKQQSSKKKYNFTPQ